MGLFDEALDLVKGQMGGTVAEGQSSLMGVVMGLVNQQGGLSGLVSQLSQGGLGNAVSSWVGTGANQPITADQMHQVLGADMVKQLAAKAGVTVEEISQKLAHLLPQAVDKMTPSGIVPKA